MNNKNQPFAPPHLAEELAPIAPFFAGMLAGHSLETRVTMPPNYFDTLANDVLAKLHAEATNEAANLATCADELTTLAPTLATLYASRQTHLRTDVPPPTYFAALPDAVLERFYAAETHTVAASRPLILLKSIPVRHWWQVSSAAAAVFAAVLFVYSLYMPTNATPVRTATSTQTVGDLSREEAAEYIHHNADDFEETLLLEHAEKATNLTNPENGIQSLRLEQMMKDEDVESYLHEQGIAD